MAFTFQKLFDPSQLTTSAAAILTVPSAPSTIFLTGAVIRLSNTTAGAVTATVYGVPSAGSAGDSTTIFPTQSIPAGSYVDVQVSQIGAGGTLQAKAGANTSITISAISGAYYS